VIVQEGLAKISDMGLCREVVASTLQTHTDTIYGTFAWAVRASLWQGCLAAGELVRC
jgi:hypothetical protein